MKNNKSKLIIYKIILIFLVIAIVITIALIIKKYGGQEQYEKKNEEIIDLFYEAQTKEENKEDNTFIEFEGYKVIGVIKIPVIDLEYPILEKTTDETMRISISRYWGGDINSLGNVSLAGHNNKITLTMFGKNKNLKNGDKIFLTDMEGKTIEYEIYDTFITDPNDVSILQTTDETTREVTLITCTNGRANRLINKAREVK